MCRVQPNALAQMESESGRAVESVWSYPRPAVAQVIDYPVTICVEDGEHVLTVAHCESGAVRVLETSHPPTYYVPPQCVTDGLLKPSQHRQTVCEWKGAATYLDLTVAGHDGGERVLEAVAWCYKEPTRAFHALRDFVCFYPRAPLVYTIDGERGSAQEGSFYGGVVTSWITGGKKGFKGGPGTWGW